MKKIKIILVLFLVLSATGCGSSNHTKQVDPIDDNYRVFYEIFVGSFSDSNGDGIGDLKGIINRLDYLNDGDINSGQSLGIQGIWLSPIFSSPSYHKYDVADYYSIDESFGSMDDFKLLLEECHKRNVKVIIDLPINHTSSQNEWFKKFTIAHQCDIYDNPYYNFYSYASAYDMDPSSSYNIISGTQEFYECNFSWDMPELNFDNEEVRQECLNIAKYYLDMGVDGFRFDAAKYIYFNDNGNSVDFWKWYMDELKKINPEIYCVGEVWSSDYETVQYISAMNCFNFAGSQAEGQIANAAKGGNVNVFVNYVNTYLKSIKNANEDAMYIPFIANHDTDRAAGYLTIASNDAFMAANLYILCSGSPFIYYGEEIGLKGSRGGANTDANRRLAMNWGDGDTVSDPEGATFAYSKQVNGTVKEQLKDKNSLYNYYCRLITLRNKYPQIARGEYSKINNSANSMAGFVIEYNGETIGLLHNTSNEELTIDLSAYNFSELADYIGVNSASFKDGILTVGAKTSAIVK